MTQVHGADLIVDVLGGTHFIDRLAQSQVRHARLGTLTSRMISSLLANHVLRQHFVHAIDAAQAAWL